MFNDEETAARQAGEIEGEDEGEEVQVFMRLAG
jgi:hypothetical protein